MAHRRFVIVLLCVVAVAPLAFVSLARGEAQAVGGTVTITGSGTRWTLTIQNASSSTGPLRCWRYAFPPGLIATGFGTLPSGWKVGGSKEASPPIITGRSSVGIPPGGVVAFPITTDKPFDTDGPAGTAKVGDCRRDTVAKVTFADAPPVSTAPKCKCKSLDVTTRGVTIGQSTWGLTAHWTLRCTGQAGGACKGELKGFGWVGHRQIKVTKPRPPKPATGPTRPVVVSCEGRCGTVPSRGSVRISGTASNRALSTAARAGRTYRFMFGSYCDGRLSKRFTVSVVFDSKGRLDRRKSDLNADGIPDR